VLQVEAAVGATLAAAERLERQEEFEVQFEVGEGLLGLRVGFEEAARVDLAVDEGVGVLAVEEMVASFGAARPSVGLWRMVRLSVRPLCS
jgi:hypothetical protein